MGPLGPQLSGVPFLANLSNITLYCTSCHQHATPVRYSICPACNVTDSAIGMNSKIAQACRTSSKINGQYILPIELRNAISQDVTKR